MSKAQLFSPPRVTPTAQACQPPGCAARLPARPHPRLLPPPSSARHLSVGAETDCSLQKGRCLQVFLPECVHVSQEKRPLHLLSVCLGG